MKKFLLILTASLIFHSSFGMKKLSTSKSIQAFFRPFLARVSSHHKNILLKEQQERIESQEIKDFGAMYWALANKKNPLVHDLKPPIIGDGVPELLPCINEYLDSYQCLQPLPLPNQCASSRITSLLYMPKKNYLISSYLAGYINSNNCWQRGISNIRCDDLTTNQEIYTLTNPEVDPRNCILTTNHNMAWANLNSPVSLGNLIDCTQTTIIKDQNITATFLAYIPELHALAMASDRSLTLLNIDTKKQNPLLAPERYQGGPIALTYIPKLKLLIVGFENGALQFLNPITKTLIATKNTVHPFERCVNSVVYLSKQNLLAVQYYDAIEIWDPVIHTFAWKFDDTQSHHFSPPGSMIYLEDQQILACQYRGENITLWDTKNWNRYAPDHVLPISIIEKSECEHMIYAPDIKTIITGSSWEGIKMYVNLVKVIKDALSKTDTITISSLPA